MQLILPVEEVFFPFLADPHDFQVVIEADISEDVLEWEIVGFKTMSWTGVDGRPSGGTDITPKTVGDWYFPLMKILTAHCREASFAEYISEEAAERTGYVWSDPNDEHRLALNQLI